MKTEAEIFYSLGDKIRTTAQPCTGLTTFVHRKDFIPKELHESFQEMKADIYLFKTEQEALDCSRALKIAPSPDSGLDTYQRPVFKVSYHGDMNSLIFKTESIIFSDTNSPEFFSRAKQIDLSYCQVKREEVIPLSGSLKIHKRNDGEYSVPLSIDYTKDLDSQLELKDSGGCVIS